MKSRWDALWRCGTRGLAMLVVTASLFSPAAHARESGRKSEDPATAKVKSLYESGTAHYNLNEFTDALSDFKEAYRIKPDPAFLFNLGQCYRQLGDPENAAKFYRSYLRASPNASNRADVEKFIADADAAVAAKARQAARPPTETQPPHLEAPPAALSATPAPPPPASKPRKWLWPVVGVAAGVVVAGVAVGLGVGLTQGGTMPPNSDLGNVGGLQ